MAQCFGAQAGVDVDDVQSWIWLLSCTLQVAGVLLALGSFRQGAADAVCRHAVHLQQQR